MAPAIPDRWTDYKPIGQKIEGTRFIAFKVPLRERISNNVDTDIRLDGNILLKVVPNLGLIIDLTNTHRYYDPQFFQRKGVVHKKLMVPGHETPSNNLVNEFNTTVKEFIANNTENDKLIGVHCTHGVNRTGYFICNYMISQMTIEPEDALERFAKARGHKIERNNYVNALQNGTESADKQNSNAEQKVELVNCSIRKGDRRGNSYKDYLNKSVRSRNRYGSRYESPVNLNGRYDGERNHYRSRFSSRDNYYERTRPPSPPPYFSNNNRRNDYYTYRRPNDGVAERNLNTPVAQGEDQTRLSNQVFYQRPRLQVDYYRTRPKEKRQQNRHHYNSNHNRHDL